MEMLRFHHKTNITSLYYSVLYLIRIYNYFLHGYKTKQRRTTNVFHGQKPTHNAEGVLYIVQGYVRSLHHLHSQRTYFSFLCMLSKRLSRIHNMFTAFARCKKINNTRADCSNVFHDFEINPPVYLCFTADLNKPTQLKGCSFDLQTTHSQKCLHIFTLNRIYNELYIYMN